MITLEELRPQLEAIAQIERRIAHARANDAPNADLSVNFHQVDSDPQSIQRLMQEVFPWAKLNVDHYTSLGMEWHAVVASADSRFDICIYTTHHSIAKEAA